MAISKPLTLVGALALLCTSANGQSLPASAVEARPDPLAERMAVLNVPGLSVAVLKDGKIVWAQGYGVLEAGKPTPVDTETIFQAASISKPISAIAALRLVEQKKLALAQPINDFLVSWRVPDNRLTERQPVTLRHIMSHSAGFTDTVSRATRAPRHSPPSCKCSMASGRPTHRPCASM